MSDLAVKAGIEQLKARSEFMKENGTDQDGKKVAEEEQDDECDEAKEVASAAEVSTRREPAAESAPSATAKETVEEKTGGAVRWNASVRVLTTRRWWALRRCVWHLQTNVEERNITGKGVRVPAALKQVHTPQSIYHMLRSMARARDLDGHGAGCVRWRCLS